MSRVRLSHQARADLDAIWDYIGITKNSPLTASRQVEAIYERMTLLAKQPLMGEAREELRPGLRSSLAGSYVILYYPLQDGIEVATVLHGSRDIEGMFRRGER